MIEPDKSPQSVLPNGSNFSWLVFAGIVVALAALDAAVFHLLNSGEYPEFLQSMFLGAWVFQPILFGVWSALRPGRLATQLPLVVPCAFVVIVAPGVHPGGFPDDRWELLIFVGAGMVILALTTLLLRAMRRYTGWQIRRRSEIETTGCRRVQFDVRYLLTLTALWAVALAIGSNLIVDPPTPTPFLGPSFFLYVAAVGGGIYFAIDLPMVAVPLLVLRGRPTQRYFTISLASWALVTCIVSMFVVTFLDGPLLDVVYWIVMGQAGAVLLGAIVAVAVRAAGYRLVQATAPSDREPISRATVAQDA